MFVLTHNQTSHFRLYSKPYFSKPFKSRMYGEGYFGETMSDVIIVFDVSSETLQGYIKVYEKRLFGKPITVGLTLLLFGKPNKLMISIIIIDNNTSIWP